MAEDSSVWPSGQKLSLDGRSCYSNNRAVCVAEQDMGTEHLGDLLVNSGG